VRSDSSWSDYHPGIDKSIPFSHIFQLFSFLMQSNDRNTPVRSDKFRDSSLVILAQTIIRMKFLMYFSLSATFGSFLALTGWWTTIEH
jgi:hypothetical protein